MHILISSQRYFGIRQSRLNLIRALLSRGHEVTLVTNFEGADPEAEIDDAGFTAIQAPFSVGSMVLRHEIEGARVLMREIRRRKPSIVHLFNAKPVLLGGMLIKLLHRHRPPILITTITGLGYSFSSSRSLGKVAGLLYGFSASRVDQHIFQNQANMDFFMSQGWAAPERSLKVAGSGVDLNRFAGLTRKPNDGRLRILFAGRFLRSKGVGDFLDIAQRARAEGLAIDFLLAGEHVSHPDAFPRAEIEAAAADGLITDLGFIHNIPELLERIDVLMLPSSYAEGIPRVLMEAGAMRIPAIVYENPGVEEFVKDGDTGFVVAPHDTTTATALLATMADNPNLVGLLGERACRRVETEFDMNNIDATHVSLYEKMAAEID
ncbi:glycosyltransferase [Celeribacter sp.]|uniref:glycosyltransferase n=1 Tax=Celeribacter sp. TaxID=1890673 RepID=UPI003A90ADF3